MVYPRVDRYRLCVACGGTGIASSGAPCYPCRSLSPTQLSVFLGCERKWWYQYVARLPREQSPGAILGEQIHAAIEGYYRTGLPPEEQLAISAIPYLPGRHGQLKIEIELAAPREWGFFSGRIDLIDLDARTVYDHKTSSNPRKYGLTIDTLPYDLQAVIYAGGAMATYGWSDCRLQWTYIPTRGKKGSTYPVSVSVTREHVEAQLSTHDEAAAMVLHKRLTLADAESAQPNARECGRYGGCPYLGICSYPKRNPLSAALAAVNDDNQSPIGDIDMGADPEVLKRVQATIAAQAAKQAAATAAKPPTPAAPPAAPPTGPAPSSVQQAILARQAAAKAAAEAAERELAEAIAAEQAAAEQAAAEAAAAAQEAARAAQDQMTGREILAQARAAKAAQAAPANGTTAAPVEGGGYTLYIGCVPLGGRNGAVEYVFADAIVRSAAQSAAVANSVSHYKEIGFGLAQAALVHQLESLLRTWTGNVVALPGREIDDAMHTLRMFAGSVIQAI